MISHPYRLRRRSLLAGATGAAALAAAAACGDDGPAGTADDPIEISFEWWGDEARAEVTQQAVDLFQEKNEGIKVRTNFADFPTYWDSMTTRMAAKDLPDVLNMDYSRLLQFGSNGLLMPLEGLVDTSDFLDGFLDTGHVNGELVAVPIAGNTLGLIYRSDWYEAAGVTLQPGYTWADYQNAIRTVTGTLPEGKWGGGDFAGQYHFMELWLRQQGGSFYTEDGKALNFDKAKLVEWWTLNADLQAEGAVPPIDVSSQWAPENGFVLDTIGADPGWDNFLAWYAPTVAENGGTLALAAPPSLDPANLGLYLKPSMQLCISATTEYPEESGKLIDFLLTDPEAIAILGTSRGIPATNVGRENVEIDEVSQAVLDYEASVEQYLTAPPPPPPAATGSIEVKFGEIYQQVQYGELTAAEAVDTFFTEAETLLAAEQ
ncbi:ABC transporter substrate-binding protein [Glycomyces albidus]|jgi:multiple sugar transport system substrate-binding protein|uniref:Extracellular solute-binding protein n=1 Tax=Glycomyces albidus TaxID=2656774 RepID=A0A6L5GBT5_9ACTN|nr:extracellular solute-binding protein [Glycomyces albidus]MQM27051.1 extracellular solute-binding protein [Glycomyces albidus]